MIGSGLRYLRWLAQTVALNVSLATLAAIADRDGGQRAVRVAERLDPQTDVQSAIGLAGQRPVRVVKPVGACPALHVIQGGDRSDARLEDQRYRLQGVQLASAAAQWLPRFQLQLPLHHRSQMQAKFLAKKHVASRVAPYWKNDALYARLHTAPATLPATPPPVLSNAKTSARARRFRS